MSNPIHWDAGLIRRYDKAGPRYTSYPTALQFHEGIQPGDMLWALAESRRAGRDLSLYVHIPFCANICYYCACNKVITKDRSRAVPYLQALYREIELLSEHVGRDQQVEQLHFGGGTPTFLSHEQMRGLVDKIRQHFTLHDDDIGDYSIEIDPREADWSTMGMLREVGFNRVSFGVQDIDPAVQRAVNRLQSLEQTQTIMDAARALEYRSINIDLIYGLPKQSPASFARTVDAIIQMRPERLSIFNYAHMPERFLPQRRIKSEDLPIAAAKLAMLENSVRQLTEAGYRYIGMDHFALPDDSLSLAQETGELHRNFQGYTTHGHCDLIGLGVSSISQVGDLFSQNTSDIKAYQQCLGESRLAIARGLTSGPEDHLRRAIIFQLICHFSLWFPDIEARFGIVFRDVFADRWPILEQMQTDGLIRLDDDAIEVLPAGRLLVRSICMVFDAYQQQAENGRFSRII
ncbi:oxygen-independent coproporphyrinogen III oxidase [Halopseudomonas pelagia]|uniref:oxygen-independent coproporphyrinogen III oxidase n=1 Tax=Halopseudomonas pelagia TaxID=553151 RepID=UPI0003A1C132|nr:oxygen-independent coproporphyrinogen III oxidase [Halopseudomonas pelagia]|tara:strand:- start:57845 stop:59227 length:1383 start_codon:yes stop_codon:yes gene_type:complete